VKFAIVTKQFVYLNLSLSADGNVQETPIVVKPGTRITVDPQEAIALLDMDYVTVHPDQYQLIS
jgi:hypothetical protein